MADIKLAGVDNIFYMFCFQFFELSITDESLIQTLMPSNIQKYKTGIFNDYFISAIFFFAINLPETNC